MVNFILGIVVGMLIAVIAMATEIFFRTRKAGIANIIDDMEKHLKPKPRASIIFPKTEEEEAQEELISINKKAGRDTKLEDL